MWPMSKFMVGWGEKIDNRSLEVRTVEDSSVDSSTLELVLMTLTSDILVDEASVED